MAAVVVIQIGATGCGALGASNGQEQQTSEASASDGGVRPLHDVSQVWHASADFDPLSPLGTFVRAYKEGMLTKHADVEQRFPGLGRASSWDYAAVQTSVEADPGPKSENRSIGAVDFFVPLVEPDGDALKVTICQSTERIAVNREGRWEHNTGAGTVWGSQLWVKQQGEEPPKDMAGTETDPRRDVFGGWTVPRYELGPNGEPDDGGISRTMRKCYEHLRLDPNLPQQDPVPLPEKPKPIPESPGWPSTK